MNRPDVVVVGGGVTGLAGALALAEAGMRVCLVDPAPAPGDGASGVPSALLTPPTGRLADKPLGHLSYASFARYPAWCAHLAEQTGISPSFMSSGSLRLYEERPRKLRPSQQWIERDELAVIEPAVRAEVAGAVRSDFAAHINPGALLAAMEAAYQLAGGTFVRSRAVSVLRAGDRVTGVRLADGGAVPAGQVIVAAGLGSRALLAPLGVELPVAADAGMIVQLAGMPQLSHIVLAGEQALVSKADGTLWASGVHTPPEGDAYDARMAASLLATVAADILGVRGRVLRAWEGVRPRAAGGIPFIGRVPGWRGLIVAAGHGSNGFLLAPLTGAAIAAWACNGSVSGESAACSPALRLGVADLPQAA